ncbi:MAG: DUF350 domain-containing protein [Gilvibacter sp.]
MNSTLFLLSLLEIVIALILSIAIFYTSFKILKRLFFKQDELGGSNNAFAIFTAGVFVSVGIILSELVPSITNVVRYSVLNPEEIGIVKVIIYAGSTLFIGFILAVLINAAVFFLFSALTRGINEFKEIKENNSSTAILIASILIAITLIVKNTIAVLISALLPFPEVANFL